MKEKLIKNYIDKLSNNDIENFALQHNIILTNSETNYIHKFIKDNWQTIIFHNNDSIFNQLKPMFTDDKYNQLYQLYQTYKNKYSHYL